MSDSIPDLVCCLDAKTLLYRIQGTLTGLVSRTVSVVSAVKVLMLILHCKVLQKYKVQCETIKRFNTMKLHEASVSHVS